MVRDVVYVVKEGEANEPLRHSLRSLVNLPHRRVWIAGYRPTWVASEVGHVAVQQGADKFDNSTRNLEAAASHPEVTDDILYFNDDFFVVDPVEDVPLMHRALVRDFAAELYRKWKRTYPYLDGMMKTLTLLEKLGVPDPLCYEVHVPMPMTKGRLLETMNVGFGTRPLHKRTLYGNMHHAPEESTLVDDPKVGFAAMPSDMPSPFVSTSDRAWSGRTGQWIRRRFAKPGPYEKP